MPKPEVLQETIFEWLPVITMLFPGAGITPFNYRELTFRWWATFRFQAEQIVKKNGN